MSFEDLEFWKNNEFSNQNYKMWKQRYNKLQNFSS